MADRNLPQVNRLLLRPATVVLVVILAFIGGLFVILPAALPFWFMDRLLGETRDGTTLYRVDEGHIRVSWGTESSVRITPTNFLTHNRSIWGLGKDQGMEEMPELALQSDVWFYDVSGDGAIAPAIDFVNPFLHDSINTAFELNSLPEDSEVEDAAILCVGASGYIYLGYAARTMEEARILFEARRAGAITDPDHDVVFNGVKLYRLRRELANDLAGDSASADEVYEIAASIPVLMEAMNDRLGHPCKEMSVLYLDGHIERISYGSKYPATPEFTSLFLYNEKP